MIGHIPIPDRLHDRDRNRDRFGRRFPGLRRGVLGRLGHELSSQSACGSNQALASRLMSTHTVKASAAGPALKSLPYCRHLRNGLFQRCIQSPHRFHQGEI